MTNQPAIISRVLTPATMQRIGLQNRVVRKLRDMGCKVIKTTLDRNLTIQVMPEAAQILRRNAVCTVMKRGDESNVISIEIDGCLIIWSEKKA